VIFKKMNRIKGEVYRFFDMLLKGEVDNTPSINKFQNWVRWSKFMGSRKG
tara:strand:+ start:821 stop:970 length:150 start_codon:yes stop_codon:yes gene_type:complete